MIEVSNLHFYPIKGLAGISLREAEVAERGFKYDRHFMLVDSNGKFISQRTHKKLALFKTELTKDKVFVSYENSQLKIPLQTKAAKLSSVKIWDDELFADELAEASQWFSEQLSENLRLIRFNKNHKRKVEPDRVSDPNAFVAFADAYPILVISEASLDLLNKHLIQRGEAALPMNRFRPNIVVKGLSAFEELENLTLSSEVSELALNLVKPCRRCPVTTVDQETAEVANPKEPLATLAKINPLEEKGAFFGGNAIIKAGFGSTLRVGECFNI